MSDTAREGLIIPGYQPVERLGAAPSFGIWIRALQTRMDRRVLLKLVSGQAPGPREFLGREIQALVRRDGDGVVRVIDEGTAGEVRYLVVDEGEGVPLEHGEAPLDEEDSRNLGATLESLFRWVGEQGWVLLPISAKSLRRTPTGFCVVDLGWLVPKGDPLPEHPRLGEDSDGKTAEAWMNGRFLGLTLRDVSEALGRLPAGSWTKEIAVLEGISAENPTWRSPFSRTGEGNRGGRRGALVALAVGLVLVVAAVTAQVIRGTKRTDSSPSGAAAIAPPKSPNTRVREVSPTIVEPGLREHDEALAAAAYDLALDLTDASQPPPWILNPDQRVKLETLINDFPETATALSAQKVLEVAEVVEAEAVLKRWSASREPILEDLAAGRLGNAEAMLEEVGLDPHSVLEPEVSGLRRRLKVSEERVVAALVTRVETLRGERRYPEASRLIDDRVENLAARGRGELAALRDLVERESLAFERSKRSLRTGIRRTLAATQEKNWTAAEAALAGSLPPEPFDGLRAIHAAWQKRLATALAQARDLQRGLAELATSRRPKSFELRSGEVRARVIAATTLGEFDLKLDGRTEVRRVSYQDLRADAVGDVIHGGEGDALNLADWGLLLVFLGDLDAAIALGSTLTPQPEWFVAASEVRAEERARDFELLWREARAAAERGEWSAVRVACQQLKEDFSLAELSDRTDELKAWLRASYRSLGLARAFSGEVTELGTRHLRIHYELTESKAARDWQAVGDTSQVHRDRRGLLVKGSAWLLVPGNPSSQIFADHLAVTADVKSIGVGSRRPPPNLNWVLWSRHPRAERRGILFALGFQPPWLHTLGGDGFLLPANVIGHLAEVEKGVDGEPPVKFQIAPQVQGSETIRLEIASDAAGVRLEWKRRVRPLKWRVPGFGSAETRQGTVEVRSYESPLLLNSVTVEGRVLESWWDEWVRRAVAKELREW